MKDLITYGMLLALMVSLCACSSGSPDDDLRAVPVTNNPNLITDPYRNTALTGIGL